MAQYNLKVSHYAFFVYITLYVVFNAAVCKCKSSAKSTINEVILSKKKKIQYWTAWNELSEI